MTSPTSNSINHNHSTSINTNCPTTICGTCSCGNVEYKLLQQPLYSAYCHCPACSKLNTTGYNFSHVYVNWSDEFTLIKPTTVDTLISYNPFPTITQYSCNVCKQPIYSHIPIEDWILTYSSNKHTISDNNNNNKQSYYKESMSHIFYKFSCNDNSNNTLMISNNLSIYSDLPSECNGSNEQVDIMKNITVQGNKQYTPGDAKLLRKNN